MNLAKLIDHTLLKPDATQMQIKHLCEEARTHGFASVCVNPVLYPDKAVIDRCALEHDWGKDTDKLLAMWSRVKGDNASGMTYVIIVLALLAIIAAIVFSNKSRKRRRKKASHR